MVICCTGGAEVLVAAPSIRTVLGAGAPEKTEGSGVCSTRAGGGVSRTEGTGA